MHYIGKEQMHIRSDPLFIIFLSKFYFKKYKFYQNVKKQRKKEVFFTNVVSHFIINVFMMSQLFFIAENTTVKRSSAISKHVSFWAGQIPAGQTSSKGTIFEMAARAFYCCLYAMSTTI